MRFIHLMFLSLALSMAVVLASQMPANAGPHLSYAMQTIEDAPSQTAVEEPEAVKPGMLEFGAVAVGIAVMVGGWAISQRRRDSS